MANKKQTTAPKKVTFKVTQVAGLSTPSAEKSYQSIVASLARLNQSRVELAKDIATQGLQLLVETKGEATGCAFVLEALARSTDYAVNRFKGLVFKIAKDVGLKMAKGSVTGFEFPEGASEWKDVEALIAKWVDPDEVKSLEIKSDEQIANEAKEAKEKNRINLRTKDGLKKFADKGCQLANQLESKNSCKAGAKLLRYVALNPTKIMALITDAQRNGEVFITDKKDL